MAYHILIADDEERIVRSMRQIIEDAFGDTVEIKTASNGIECIGIRNTWPVNLLVTDIRMPGLNGVELVEAIREKDSEVEILVISAYEDFNYAKQLIPYGVLEYLVKPISVDQILNMVRRTMQKSSGSGNEIRGEEKEPEEKYRMKALIREAQQHIKNQVYSATSLADVAEYLHVNKSYLSVTFKNEAGENISSYINAIKIKEAKKLLLETEYSVGEIAERLGYNTAKYFIDKFSKSTGMTPAKYRGVLNKSIE